MIKTMIFLAVVALVFSGCVGTESPIGKGVILTKPDNSATKTVQK